MPKWIVKKPRANTAPTISSDQNASRAFGWETVNARARQAPRPIANAGRAIVQTIIE